MFCNVGLNRYTKYTYMITVNSVFMRDIIILNIYNSTMTEGHRSITINHNFYVIVPVGSARQSARRSGVSIVYVTSTG